MPRGVPKKIGPDLVGIAKQVAALATEDREKVVKAVEHIDEIDAKNKELSELIGEPKRRGRKPGPKPGSKRKAGAKKPGPKPKGEKTGKTKSEGTKKADASKRAAAPEKEPSSKNEPKAETAADRAKARAKEMNLG